MKFEQALQLAKELSKKTNEQTVVYWEGDHLGYDYNTVKDFILNEVTVAAFITHNDEV